MSSDCPFDVGDEAALDELLSRPQPATVEALREVDGDILILGAGGKMGPSLARMARRAADAAENRRRIVAVSRFSDPAVRSWLNDAGVETLSGDLLDPNFVESLPQFPNVIYMVGLKFGTSQQAGATWVTNAFVPGLICRRFSQSRIVSFSTGNVYPLVRADSGGARELDHLEPVGEYGMSALARERIFEHFSTALDLPVAIHRLNYAVEMRYGVLVDLAQQIALGQPISLAMGYFNCIWQGDANELVLRSLSNAASPPRVFNLTGPETVSTRDVCQQLGCLMDRPATFRDEPDDNALLSNAADTLDVLGAPTVGLEQVVQWTAEWVGGGGTTWNRPTHFEVRDGRY